MTRKKVEPLEPLTMKHMVRPDISTPRGIRMMAEKMHQYEDYSRIGMLNLGEESIREDMIRFEQIRMAIDQLVGEGKVPTLESLAQLVVDNKGEPSRSAVQNTIYYRGENKLLQELALVTNFMVSQAKTNALRVAILNARIDELDGTAVTDRELFRERKAREHDQKSDQAIRTLKLLLRAKTQMLKEKIPLTIKNYSFQLAKMHRRAVGDNEQDFPRISITMVGQTVYNHPYFYEILGLERREYQKNGTHKFPLEKILFETASGKRWKVGTLWEKIPLEKRPKELWMLESYFKMFPDQAREILDPHELKRLNIPPESDT